MNLSPLLRFIFVFLVTFFTAILGFGSNLKVMAYNIRCGSCEDISSINHWSKRKFLINNIIKEQTPDLIGFQEAEVFQVKDLANLLGEYDWIGVGRDDGKEQGEATTIFYRKNRFKLKSQKTLWLSDTPEVVSKGWDARYNRTVTLLKLRDLLSNREFYIFNTHLDNSGVQARIKGVQLMLNLINATTENLPVILTGDFNFTRDFSAYNIVTGKLLDAQFRSQTPAAGGDQTFNGFGTNTAPHNKIDFIFINDFWNVLSHAIITKLYDGHYPSDHFPVQAQLQLK